MSEYRHEDMVALCDRYVRSEITADEYFAAVEVYAKQAIEDELRPRKKARR